MCSAVSLQWMGEANRTPSVGEFVWFTHQPASTGWLKRELAVKRPDLRFAFSRPGLTTFKVDRARANDPIACSFARAHGRSLGRATSAEEVLALASSSQPQTSSSACARLHVFERDPDRPADERDVAIAGTRAAAFDVALRAAAPGRFFDAVEAQVGDVVLDVVVAAAEEPDDGIFVGWHRHDTSRGPFPGGVPHVAIPAAAPSRAWAKLEEAIRWSGVVPRAGEYAVDLGSAPGGASLALLERGLHVHGVDPGVMDPLVLMYTGASGNRFTHHALPAAEVARNDLPRTYAWLTCDINLAPMIALKYVERFVALAHGGLRGAFVTLKLNDDGVFEALPRLAVRIAKLGAARVRYTQLPSHRSEIVAILEW
jgi:23S rRNA (cytidine2498-2'-O)-methyltransferase